MFGIRLKSSTLTKSVWIEPLSRQDEDSSWSPYKFFRVNFCYELPSTGNAGSYNEQQMLDEVRTACEFVIHNKIYAKVIMTRGGNPKTVALIREEVLALIPAMMAEIHNHLQQSLTHFGVTFRGVKSLVPSVKGPKEVYSNNLAAAVIAVALLLAGVAGFMIYKSPNPEMPKPRIIERQKSDYVPSPAPTPTPTPAPRENNGGGHVKVKPRTIQVAEYRLVKVDTIEAHPNINLSGKVTSFSTYKNSEHNAIDWFPLDQVLVSCNKQTPSLEEPRNPPNVQIGEIAPAPKERGVGLVKNLTFVSPFYEPVRVVVCRYKKTMVTKQV
ncbi:MAG: hypothetical protein US50_C0008G0009 [Candidatus Nomurabacteria bacterium GW2011_GWB1_37_5]|uniref:Uncharacterized protein n=1 Tax=Candidatus Nomurabacteria bacterium GW2011_GWB1_37_5 TaxID=1618742 RepID=A0A0G0GXG9_9BACT|nr:MAG: hypothetical protein US50_C0008G0009 [Candidatus Nomurabacteria bacterium GW2011_GWB1_37_5]